MIIGGLKFFVWRHNEAYNVASNKNAENVYSADKYPLCHTYNYGFNIIRYLCCCKQTVYKVAANIFFLFFRQAIMGGVVANRVLQT